MKRHILLFTLSILMIFFQSTEQGILQLSFKGIEEYKGYIQVDLYKSNEGFPTENEFAYKILRFKLDSVNDKMDIAHLDYGTYAIAVYHDENSDGELDTNFFGKPTEKTGASNNPDNGNIPIFDDADARDTAIPEVDNNGAIAFVGRELFVVRDGQWRVIKGDT